MTVLALRSVSKHYSGPPAVRALSCVDLTIGAGDYCAIKGPSGSGKSTLLNILGLLDQPTSGAYTVGDRQTVGLRSSEVDGLRARTFGFVFQSSYMLSHWTVSANVSLGLRAQVTPRRSRIAAVEAALDSVALLHRASALARDLSGGERQRAAIARAVCARPTVLLADEPTGNLDSKNSALVMSVLDGICARGVTVIVVTHDDNVAAHATRQIRVSDGTLTVDRG